MIGCKIRELEQKPTSRSNRDGPEDDHRTLLAKTEVVGRRCQRNGWQSMVRSPLESMRAATCLNWIKRLKVVKHPIEMLLLTLIKPGNVIILCFAKWLFIIKFEVAMPAVEDFFCELIMLL